MPTFTRMQTQPLRLIVVDGAPKYIIHYNNLLLLYIRYSWAIGLVLNHLSIYKNRELNMSYVFHMFAIYILLILWILLYG